MKCPGCQHPDSRVIDSRRQQWSRIRRRKCARCHYRFITTEVVGARDVNLPLLTPMVAKKDGTVESFDHKKLHNSVVRAIHKRQRSAQTIKKIEEFADSLEQEVSLSEANISSVELGQRALSWLRANDELGYLRYASMHEEFNTPDDFIKILSRLKK